MQRLAILGSTGSIGKQALEVAERYPELFEIYALTANNNWQLLVEQALKYRPDSVTIANPDHYRAVKNALAGEYIKVYTGSEAVAQAVENSRIDTVVAALVGYAGLEPTLHAVRAGKKIALANKETLVVAGETVMQLAAEYKTPVLPVDSEHSAIFQSLAGETGGVEKVILTASGGPFLHTPKEALEKVTPEQALEHPNWSMGKKITVDSATLMNKGFEVIEAKWLFGLDAEQIEVVIHPSSVIHSMVQFCDGAIKAQLGTPDMKLPIQYALTFPERLPMAPRLKLTGEKLEFSAPDTDRFPCLALAYEAMRKGGNTPCVMNAANEIAVEAFLNRQIRFTDIPRIIEYCINKTDFISSPSLEDYRCSDRQARERAGRYIERAVK